MQHTTHSTPHIAHHYSYSWEAGPHNNISQLNLYPFLSSYIAFQTQIQLIFGFICENRDNTTFDISFTSNLKLNFNWNPQNFSEIQKKFRKKLREKQSIVSENMSRSYTTGKSRSLLKPCLDSHSIVSQTHPFFIWTLHHINDQNNRCTHDLYRPLVLTDSFSPTLIDEIGVRSPRIDFFIKFQ